MGNNMTADSVEQRCSYECGSPIASQEIPCLLWNSKVYYHAYSRMPLDPVLSHINPVHILTHNFVKVNFNIIFLFTPRSPGWSVHIFQLKMEVQL
jgi:hypothetical protein